jgi:CheY-like chemotaxis protein
MKYRIYLIHWNAAEAAEKSDLLRQAGFAVELGTPNAAGIRALKDNPPDAFVIDLSRLPSQGRDAALVIRQGKATRHVPIVFVGGSPEKIEMVMGFLPDASFTSWDKAATALKAAISNPPPNPIVPKSVLDGYSNAPLVKKLGIRPNSHILLIDPPPGFKKLIADLPHDVKFIETHYNECDLIIWFVQSSDDLQQKVKSISGTIAPRGGLWICWPKKASGIDSDLNQQVVRQIGLDIGLVDYKVCAIDGTWSGLKFTRRKSD